MDEIYAHSVVGDLSLGHRPKETFEKVVQAKSVRVEPFATVSVQELLSRCGAKLGIHVAAQASHHVGDVGMPICEARAADVDEPRYTGFCNQHVGQAEVAMGYDSVSIANCVDCVFESFQYDSGRQALLAGQNPRPVDQTGFNAFPRIDDCRRQGTVKRIAVHRGTVKFSNGVGEQLNHGVAFRDRPLVGRRAAREHPHREPGFAVVHTRAQNVGYRDAQADEPLQAGALGLELIDEVTDRVIDELDDGNGPVSCIKNSENPRTRQPDADGFRTGGAQRRIEIA